MGPCPQGLGVPKGWCPQGRMSPSFGCPQGFVSPRVSVPRCACPQGLGVPKGLCPQGHMSPKSGCPQGLGVPRCVCPQPCASPGPCVRAGDGATVPSQGDIPPAAPELGGDVWRPPRPPSLARHCHRHLAGAPVATHVPCTLVHHHACASACTRACVLVCPPCTGGGGSVGTWGPSGFVPRFCPHILGTWWPGRWQGPPQWSQLWGRWGRSLPIQAVSPPGDNPVTPPGPCRTPLVTVPSATPVCWGWGQGTRRPPSLGGFGVPAWWHGGTAAPGGGLWGQSGAPPQNPHIPGRRWGQKGDKGTGRGRGDGAVLCHLAQSRQRLHECV